MSVKYILKYLIGLYLFFSLLYFLQTSFNKTEGFSDDMSDILDKGDAFCKNYQGSSNILEEKCGLMNKTNCNATSCCIWTSGDKCVAGDANGATFNTDTTGKTQQLEYYYFQDKCYGENCPK